MADNSIPTSYDPIVQLLEDAADGAHTHGAAIGLVHNDEAHIRTDLIALVGNLPGRVACRPPCRVQVVVERRADEQVRQDRRASHRPK